jgi:hypothetical protein
MSEESEYTPIPPHILDEIRKNNALEKIEEFLRVAQIDEVTGFIAAFAGPPYADAVTKSLDFSRVNLAQIYFENNEAKEFIDDYLWRDRTKWIDDLILGVMANGARRERGLERHDPVPSCAKCHGVGRRQINGVPSGTSASVICDCVWPDETPC